MPEAREFIAAMARYRSPITDRLRLNLDLNENAAGCSADVLAKLQSLAVEDLARYPQREVGEQIVADFLEVSPNNVLLTNGIDEALQVICATYLDQQSQLLLADPTFSMYRVYGHATGATVSTVALGEEFLLSIDHFLGAINERTKLILIANPNNPTGTTVAREDLLRVLRAAENAAVVVDEAYFEFYGETLLGDVAAFPNLFIARTFSKAYGLAGLRLGAIVASERELDLLRRLTSPFNINGIALACLPVALQDRRFMQNYVQQVKTGREDLYRLCDELRIRYWHSAANFVLIQIGQRSEQFIEEMRRSGVAISDRGSDAGCQGCVRITIPTQAEMPYFSDAFKKSFRAAVP